MATGHLVAFVSWGGGDGGYRSREGVTWSRIVVAVRGVRVTGRVKERCGRHTRQDMVHTANQDQPAGLPFTTCLSSRHPPLSDRLRSDRSDRPLPSGSFPATSVATSMRPARTEHSQQHIQTGTRVIQASAAPPNLLPVSGGGRLTAVAQCSRHA